MKVLVTGCNQQQTNSQNTINKILSSIHGLVACLDTLGHSVTWKPVEVGQDLSEYDLVIVALAPFQPFSTWRMAGALWALYSHPRVKFTVDDWQTRNIRASMNRLMRSNYWWWKIIWGPAEERGADPKWEPILKGMIHYLRHEPWINEVLAPCWEGGDTSELRLGAPITVYDPSPFLQPYQYQQDLLDFKERKWIMASLTKKTHWLERQKLTWPVDIYGNARQGFPKVPESELANIYSKTWGVISPPHNVGKSGWFRVRFLMSAAARCVMLAGADEAKIMGHAFNVNASEVEKYSDNQLKELASAQVEAFKLKCWSRDQMMTVINNFILR